MDGKEKKKKFSSFGVNEQCKWMEITYDRCDESLDSLLHSVLCSLIHIFMAHNSWEVVKTSLIAESRCVVSTNASFSSHVTRVYNVEERSTTAERERGER